MLFRRSISSLLIGVLLINVFGCLVAYSIFKSTHHEKIARFLTDKSAEKTFENLHLSREEFSKLVWRRTGKEFERNNNLYDIVSVDYHTDSVFVVCYKDDHEKKMEKHYAKALDSNGSDTSPSQTRLLILNHKYIPLSESQLYFAEEGEITLNKKEYFNYCGGLSSPHITIFYPPPNTLAMNSN